MKKLWKRISARFRQPKWRHGKLGALLMACFALVCVLINVGVKALEEEYGWRRDLSFNGYATTGPQTKETLERLEKDVELYLLYQNDAIDSPILELLNRYAVLSERVDVLPTDIAKNPGILANFQSDLSTAVQANTIVVNCPETGRYRLLTYGDFFVQGYSVEKETFVIEGLAYEKSLTEAIVYVTQDEIPTIGILQGHGEMPPATLENFISFLKSNHYDCVPINLMEGSTLEDIDLLLIAGPQYDLNHSEITQISDFAQEGHHMLVMRNYTDSLEEMPNYLSLLRSYGVTPIPGLVVADVEEAGSYFDEPIFITPYMCELDMTLPLIYGGIDVLFLPGACAFEAPPAPDQSLSVATVLKTGKRAYVRDPSDGKNTLEKQEGDREGELSLALYAHRTHATGNVSRMFAIGNSALFTEEYIYQRTNNEQFFLQIMGELLPQKSVSLDIMASSAFHPALRVGSQTLGVALLVALPLLSVMAALCVLLPRRNR